MTADLGRFPPNLFIRLSLFRFLGSLLRPFLRHMGLQLLKLLFLFLFRERLDLVHKNESGFISVTDGDTIKKGLEHALPQ